MVTEEAAAQGRDKVVCQRLQVKPVAPPPSSHFLTFTPVYHAFTVSKPGVKLA